MMVDPAKVPPEMRRAAFNGKAITPKPNVAKATPDPMRMLLPSSSTPGIVGSWICAAGAGDTGSTISSYSKTVFHSPLLRF